MKSVTVDTFWHLRLPWSQFLVRNLSFMSGMPFYKNTTVLIEKTKLIVLEKKPQCLIGIINDFLLDFWAFHNCNALKKVWLFWCCMVHLQNFRMRLRRGKINPIVLEKTWVWKWEKSPIICSFLSYKESAAKTKT